MYVASFVDVWMILFDVDVCRLTLVTLRVPLFGLERTERERFVGGKNRNKKICVRESLRRHHKTRRKKKERNTVELKNWWKERKKERMCL